METKNEAIVFAPQTLPCAGKVPGPTLQARSRESGERWGQATLRSDPLCPSQKQDTGDFSTSVSPTVKCSSNPLVNDVPHSRCYQTDVPHSRCCRTGVLATTQSAMCAEGRIKEMTVTHTHGMRPSLPSSQEGISGCHRAHIRGEALGPQQQGGGPS